MRKTRTNGHVPVTEVPQAIAHLTVGQALKLQAALNQWHAVNAQLRAVWQELGLAEQFLNRNLRILDDGTLIELPVTGNSERVTT